MEKVLAGLAQAGFTAELEETAETQAEPEDSVEETSFCRFSRAASVKDSLGSDTVSLMPFSCGSAWTVSSPAAVSQFE